MGQAVQSVTLENIGATTTYTEKNSISIMNQSVDDLDIVDITHGGGILLKEGQSVTLTSSTGFVLPTLMLDSAGVIRASVITT